MIHELEAIVLEQGKVGHFSGMQIFKLNSLDVFLKMMRALVSLRLHQLGFVFCIDPRIDGKVFGNHVALLLLSKVANNFSVTTHFMLNQVYLSISKDFIEALCLHSSINDGTIHLVANAFLEIGHVLLVGIGLLLEFGFSKTPVHSFFKPFLTGGSRLAVDVNVVLDAFPGLFLTREE